MQAIPSRIDSQQLLLYRLQAIARVQVSDKLGKVNIRLVQIPDQLVVVLDGEVNVLYRSQHIVCSTRSDVILSTRRSLAIVIILLA